MRDITYPPIVMLARTAFRALGLKIQIVGDEQVPTEGGAVFAVNHISYLDFIFSGFAAHRSKRLVRFMAKRELFDHRVTGPIMRSMHHINVDRAEGVASVQKALDYLAAGEIVGIFPEATISRSFELKEFKTGAVRLAAQADVPIIPVVVWGTQRMITKDHPRDLSRGKAVSITVGAPMTVTTADDPIAATAHLKQEMAHLLDQTIKAYPDSEEGAWWMPQSYGGSAPTLQEAKALELAEKRQRAEQRRAERNKAKRPDRPAE
jgi:1-acyl-sn-glycerol-3-phosphate acyltransferase